MALKYNPFTGSFDQVGSGGGGSSYIDGEVATYADLPVTVGTPAVDSAYLVRTASGSWGGLVNRRPAGIYVRTANAGALSDWTYASAFPDVFNASNFLLYDNADSSKNLQFNVSGITTGTTRTLTAPNYSGTIAATNSAGETLFPSGSGFTLTVDGSALTTNRFIDWPDTSGTIMVTGDNLNGLTNLPLARTNIGLGSGDSPTFTNLTLSRGTITTSSPVSFTQTWNSSGVAFRGLEISITNTASDLTSSPLRCLVGGTSMFTVRRDGDITGAVAFNASTGTSAASITSTGGVRLGPLAPVQWASDTNQYVTADLVIRRDAAATLAQRNGTNAQAFRLYGTFTDASNGRWLSISSTTAGVFSIAPTGNGTGASGNVLHISGLPTSNPGPGILWNNSGSVAIGT